MDLMDFDGPEYAISNTPPNLESQMDALIQAFDMLTMHDRRGSKTSKPRRLTDHNIIAAMGIKKKVTVRKARAKLGKFDLARLQAYIHKSMTVIPSQPRYVSPLSYSQRVRLWQKIQWATMIETPTTFHSFPLLPPELRTRIWELARPEARIVKVQWSKKGTPYSASTIPGLLHACFESRIIALQWYSLAFSQPWDSTVNEIAPKISHKVTESALGVTPGQKITKRAFFDATRDWIFHGCGCGIVWCQNCQDLYGERSERLKISRVLLTCEKDMQSTPFYAFTLYFKNVQDLLLIEPGETMITPDSKFSDLKPSATTFKFQVKSWRPFMSLQELLDDEKQRVVDLFTRLGFPVHEWHLHRIASVRTKQKKITWPTDFTKTTKT